jgi:hypothetical protein
MGIAKITEKPVIDSAASADYVLAVIDGKLYRAELATLADVLAEDQVAKVQEIMDAQVKAATDQAEEAGKSAQSAQQYSGQPPIIQDGTWWIWDADQQQYTDTGLPARGLQGETGPRGVGVEGIAQTDGDHSPGTFDTYTLTMTDGTAQTIIVYNGKNGKGTGDMETETYDPQGKRTDIFQFVLDAVPEWARQPESPKYTADGIGALPISGGTMTGDLSMGENQLTGLPEPTEDSAAATKHYADQKVPISVKMTLAASGWSDGTQTLKVSGVLEDETAQMITCSPLKSSRSAYNSAGILCTDQGDGTLTFTASTTPTENIDIFVVIQDVRPRLKTALTAPSYSGSSLTYSGSAQSPALSDYDSAKITLGGTTTAIDAGTYNVTIALTDPSLYEWEDGSTEDKIVTWSIGKATPAFTLSAAEVSLDVDHPSATVTVDTDSDGAISASSSDTGIVTVSVSGAEVTSSMDSTMGSVTVTISQAESANYFAASGTVSVTAGPAVLAVPSQSGTLTFNGEEQKPTFDYYDSAKMAISGTYYQANAGTYDVTFTLADPSLYEWEDGSAEDKTVTWEIGKAAGSISGIPSSITLNKDTTSVSFDITWDGDGALTLSSSDENVATAEQGNISVSCSNFKGADGETVYVDTSASVTITVSSVNDTTGTAVITFDVAEGKNCYATSATVEVTADFTETSS